MIPYDPADLPRLRTAITPGWVTSLPALQQLVDASAGVSLQASVYTLSGCAALNIVVSPVSTTCTNGTCTMRLEIVLVKISLKIRGNLTQ